MRFAGRVLADQPDPAEESRALAAALKVDVAGFSPQRHLEDWGISGATSTREGIGSGGVVRSASFSRVYTLWRNPDDCSDPANFAVVSAQMKDAALREAPPDLPPWLLRQRER